MRIMIMGAGGVGGYIAGALAQRFEHITLIARGAHLAAIRKNGLTVIQDGSPFTVYPNVTDQPAACGVQDIIFVCTKGYGLDAALEQLRPCVGAHTLVIPLLNGVNIYRRVEAALHTETPVSASIYIYSKIISPGVIEKNGALLRIVVGVPGGSPEQAPESLKKLVGMLNEAGVPTEIPADILLENWKKWAMLIANGQPNAYFNAPIGAIREDPEKLDFVKALVREVVAVAAAEGISLPCNLEDTILQTIDSLPYESTSSLSRDIAEPGKPTELSLFAGELCHLADKHGVDVPANRSMLARFGDRL